MSISRCKETVSVHNALPRVDVDIDALDVDHGSLNSFVSPIAILFCQLENKLLYVLGDARSAAFLLLGTRAVVLLGNQRPVPPQYGIMRSRAASERQKAVVQRPFRAMLWRSSSVRSGRSLPVSSAFFFLKLGGLLSRYFSDKVLTWRFLL